MNSVAVQYYLNGKGTLPDLAIKYYRAFVSQFISFIERDAKLVREHLTLEEIREYGITNSITSFVRDVNILFQEKNTGGLHDTMWEIACTAPHQLADVYDRRILVILDEFQNIASYVYRNQNCEGRPDDSLAGSFHSLSESKIAPMLVTGSYISWLLEIAGKYLQAGRLDNWRINPYLTPDEGLEAVYRYAQVYNEPVTNETALLICRLCMSDPFFIKRMMQSTYGDRNLMDAEGVIETYNYEITDRNSMMSKTWNEYIQLTLQKINDRHAKSMLLFLSKHSNRFWTHREIKNELQIDLDLNEIQKKLLLLVEADVIEWGVSDIQFRGLQDGTLNLILRNRFEEEINGFIPDLKHEAHQQVRELQKEKRQLQGKLNNLSGQFAEYQLFMSFRSKKRFALSEYFSGVRDTARLNIIDVKQRAPLLRENGKRMELDVVAESGCGRMIVVEVKKRKIKTGKNIVEDFDEKVRIYAKSVPDKIILPVFLSLGGFTDEAMRFCEERGIGTAECIVHF